MTTITTNTSGRAITGRLQGLISYVKDSGKRYRVYRKTLTELDKLTDRELSDIGISRSMIYQIATEAANSAK